MIRYVSSHLFRAALPQSIYKASVNRQPCRFLEDFSYSTDFNVVKRQTEEEGKKSRKNIDESTRKIRSGTEGVFAQNGVTITSYSEYGFRLNGSIKTLGPIVLFPRCVFAWNIARIEDINEDSLCIFYMIQPKIDTLIIGTGDKPITPAIGRTILEVTRKHRINIEILSTETACTTFNFLNQQGRMVAAALVPPIDVHLDDDDAIATQARDNKLFSIEKMRWDKLGMK